MDRAKKLLALVLAIITTFSIMAVTACAPAGGETADVTTLIYANLTHVDREAVAAFNRTHTDVQIEVRDYFDENGRTGQERLMTEIAAGKIPDIIDLGNTASFFSLLPYEVLAQKGYLEDLWPYIDSDPELGREGVLEAPLKAAEVNGGLYVLFSEVWLNTLVGAENIVGDRTSWPLAELQEAFATMPEGSTVLPCYYRKLDAFGYMLSMSLDSYVDWETGQCFFGSEDFRNALQFVNSFPDEPSDTEDRSAEVMEQIYEGKLMLWPYPISDIMRLQMADVFMGRGGRVSFVGYPTADGSIGSSFHPIRNKLCMSSNCRNKEAAWEFLRQIILPKYSREQIRKGNGPLGIPINREDYDTMKSISQSAGFVPKKVGFGNPDTIWVECHKATDEEWARYEDLISSISKVSMCDSTLFSIVWDTCGPYFAGDKTLDETIAMIQNRVSLYVNESR